MTTELEQEFFKVFGVEKTSFNFICNKNKCNKKRLFGRFNCLECDNETKKEIKVYPEITDRRLLQLLCIYNDMQNCIDLCITPCKYKDAKEMILSTLVNEKSEMIDCEEGTYMDVMTKQIQQLFKEGE